MTTRADPYDVTTSEDAEQAAYLRQWAEQHPAAILPNNRWRAFWRGFWFVTRWLARCLWWLVRSLARAWAWRIAYLAVLAVGLVFLLAGLWLGLTEPGMWAALAVVGAVLLFALMLAGRG